MTATLNAPVMIGLTGGIASGKSTVSNMLRELGAAIIDADVIAREVVAPGAPALDVIRDAFGDEVITADGALDREALGAIVFDDADARARLNAITHPRIGQRMWERARELFEAGHPWVIYDAALIVENNLHEMLDSLIVVSLSPDIQLERLMARDDLTDAQARQRVAAQLPLADKVAAADFVIDNDGALAQTRAQVEALYRHIDEAVRERGTARPPAA